MTRSGLVATASDDAGALEAVDSARPWSGEFASGSAGRAVGAALGRFSAQRDLIETGRAAVCDRHAMTPADLAASYLELAG
jgi:hypothetical protein